ncbi:MAG: laccase domain-containing protein, partial [Roseibacillus sp.]|nr:laccase domain-containing protein [Roseibacillus sp.]
LWRAEQVHGNVVVQVPSDGAAGQIVEGADGLVTCGRDQVLLGIYVADCAAVYIRACRTGALGLVH